MRLLRRPITDQKVTATADSWAAGNLIELDVPFEETDEVKALGASWSPTLRRWFGPAADRDRLRRWLPSQGIDLGPETGLPITISIFGLTESCWRCAEPATAIVGMIEARGNLSSKHLLLCDDELPLALADRYLPLESRERWKVGPVRRRYSATIHASYLSNGCPTCDAIKGAFPLFHEAVPDVLGDDGKDFVTLAQVLVPLDRWLRNSGGRWG